MSKVEAEADAYAAKSAVREAARSLQGVAKVSELTMALIESDAKRGLEQLAIDLLPFVRSGRLKLVVKQRKHLRKCMHDGGAKKSRKAIRLLRFVSDDRIRSELKKRAWERRDAIRRWCL